MGALTACARAFDLGCEGVVSCERYPDGSVRSCRLDAPRAVRALGEDLVARWGPQTPRTKHIASLAFYEDGSLRSVYLEGQQRVATSLGPMPAEFVTLYPSGALNSVFPVNGQLSGFWGIEDERALCPVLTLRLACGAFCVRVVCLRFYESGALRSVTLWPDESVVLRTNAGPLPTRNGFALYEDGTVKCVEPSEPLAVRTPVGILDAYDCQAVGVTGDMGSLAFDGQGRICAVATSTSTVCAIAGYGESVTFAPWVERGRDGEAPRVHALRASFNADGSVCLDNGRDHASFGAGERCYRTGVDAAAAEVLGAASADAPGTGGCGDCSTCALTCTARL